MNDLSEFTGEKPLPDLTTKTLKAGEAGQESGSDFEDQVADMLDYHYVSFDRQVPFRDPYSGRKRKCDFGYRDAHGIRVFVECKNLSDLGSHRDKLTTHWDMARRGAYGSCFYLVYDAYNNGTTTFQQKLQGERNKFKSFQNECVAKGITIEFLHYSEFEDKIINLKECLTKAA